MEIHLFVSYLFCTVASFVSSFSSFPVHRASLFAARGSNGFESRLILIYFYDAVNRTLMRRSRHFNNYYYSIF